MGYIEQFPEILENYDITPLKYQIYDYQKNKDAFENIPFTNYEVVFIAFSLMTIQIPLFERFITKNIEDLRRYHKKMFFIVGGAHATAEPAWFSKFGIDFIIPNEGEKALESLLLASIEHDPKDIDLQDLIGVHRGFPQYEIGTPTQPVPLDAAPPFSEKFKLFGPIEISRGCPFQCKFCQTGNNSPRMRHASVETILKWVKRASEIKYDKMWFLSPNAFAYGSKNGVTPNLEMLQSLLSGIRTNIPAIKQIFFGTFPSEVRPESINKDVMELIVPFISNRKLALGAQTASNRLLKSIQRGHTFEDVLQAITILNQYKFQVDLDFIFGLPGETEDDLQQSLSFFNHVLEGKYPNVKIHTHTFMPLPGTPFAKEKHGIVDSRIMKIIGKLTHRGKAYGEYQAQAKQISNKFALNN